MEAAGDSPADINMELTEILLILLGILAFVVSFILPEKMSSQGSVNVKIQEEKIKELVEKEVKQAAFQIEEKVEETMNATTEKTERYMERMSNEKIMAIQEYSDTVLSQINKNHEEAVFLYDMLNNKHVQVKNTVAEIGNKVQNVKADTENKMQEEMVVDSIMVSGEIRNEDKVASEGENQKVKGPATKRKVPAKKNAMKKSKNIEKVSDIEIQFDSDSNVGSDKNKILKLHEEGKSNMAIAKSLGLGIGEVKLIIDLFEAEV